MKKLTFLSVILTTLISCKSFNGELSVHNDISLKNSKGLVSIAPGEYKSSVNFKSKKKAELKIGKHEFELKFDNKLKIPTSGDFKVLAKDWNQNYDLIGTTASTKEVGPLRHDYESCTERIPYTVCDRRGNCRVIYRDFYGTRHAEYRVITTFDTIVFNLVNEGEAFATMNGGNTSFEKRYEYTGPCR